MDVSLVSKLYLLASKTKQDKRKEDKDFYKAKASRGIANLLERKNIDPLVYCVKYLSVCPPVTNFQLNYFRTSKGGFIGTKLVCGPRDPGAN